MSNISPDILTWRIFPTSGLQGTEHESVLVSLGSFTIELELVGAPRNSAIFSLRKPKLRHSTSTELQEQASEHGCFALKHEQRGPLHPRLDLPPPHLHLLTKVGSSIGTSFTFGSFV